MQTEVRQRDTEGEITPRGGLKFTAILSTDALDRDSEVVIPSGMYSKDFEKNPVLLYAHDPTKPIGKVLSLRRGLDDVRGEFEITPRPENYEGEWFPDFVKGLIEAGVIRGISIGFAPMAGGWRVANKADKDRYGGECKGVYSRWNLHEVSVVSVPANQDALIVAIQKGSVTANQCKEFLGMSPVTKTVDCLHCPDCPGCEEEAKATEPVDCEKCPECPECLEQKASPEPVVDCTKCPDCPECAGKEEEEDDKATVDYMKCAVAMTAAYMAEGQKDKDAFSRAKADCKANAGYHTTYKAPEPVGVDEDEEEEEEETHEEAAPVSKAPPPTPQLAPHHHARRHPVARPPVKAPDTYRIKINVPPLGMGEVGDIVAREVAKQAGRLRRH